jgi:type III secretion system low calcium response chaperone LcrH/SycD
MAVTTRELTEQVAGVLTAGIPLGAVHDWNERDCEALYALGHSLYAQARYPDAVKVFGHLVTHNHLERRFVKAFASSLQMAKNHKDAVHFHTMAWAMDMTDPVPLFHSCECLMAMGLRAEAREGLEVVVRQCDEPKLDALKERAKALAAALATAPAQVQAGSAP